MGKTKERQREFISVEHVQEHFLPKLESERRRANRTAEETARDDADRIIRDVRAHVRSLKKVDS